MDRGRKTDFPAELLRTLGEIVQERVWDLHRDRHTFLLSVKAEARWLRAQGSIILIHSSLRLPFCLPSAGRRTVAYANWYQGRFKSSPGLGDEHALNVLRCVERNRPAAGLATRAEH